MAGRSGDGRRAIEINTETGCFVWGGKNMENRREEILGLKRLLVGVIVTALLITMLPFENLMTKILFWLKDCIPMC